MKVTLDLGALLEHGEITQLEFDRFSRLAARGTASLAFNILIGFGVIAVSGASLALLPSEGTAIVLGLLVSILGMALVVSGLLNKQVGGELGISEITVKAHRGQVMRKMKADSLADLVTMAAGLGLRSVPKH